MTFDLHPNLARKDFVSDLPLCTVLLEDVKEYPWILLVPRRPSIARIMDLSADDQLQLLKEIDTGQKILWQQCNPTQLNVAAIGNKTPQLHVHIIARFDNDPAWPGTVWDHPVRSKYVENEKRILIASLQEQFKQFIS
jgi:diadenosine tetraphosphate (Ap4A) HIT family hydrolase